MLNFYDFEVFSHDWLVVIINPVEKTKTVIINDREKLSDYFQRHKNEIWLGWNSSRYDTTILKAILLRFNPKSTSDHIINEGMQEWQIDRKLGAIVINDYDVKYDRNIGLKQVEGFKGLDIIETSVPFSIDRKLTEEELLRTIEYCTNDVEQTMEIFMENKADFDARIEVIKRFNLPLNTISLTKAKLISTVVRGRKKRLYDNDIFLPDNLKLGKYSYIKDWFLQNKQELNCEIAGVPHTIAWGGLHGAREKYSSEGMIIHLDVNQMYPHIMIRYGLLSRACRSPEKYKEILDTSMQLKKYDAEKRKPYKDLSNIMYGAMRDEFNPLYDLRNAQLVCAFGQLFMIDLIEKLEPFCELIQSNTDGIYVKIEKEDFNRLDDMVCEWEDRTGLSMDFKHFKKIVQKDVNNYVALDVYGKIKAKGSHVKGNDLEIVNEAVIQCLIYNKNPYDTIMNCTDLRKFQKIVKLSDKFVTACHNGRNIGGSIFRVFASRDMQDGAIGRKKDIYTSKYEKFPSTPAKCFIMNECVNGVKIPFKMDRWWYIDMAEKRIKDYGKTVYINKQQELELL